MAGQPLSRCAAAIAAVTAALVVLTGGAAARASSSPAGVPPRVAPAGERALSALVPSAKERRAVRGRAVLEPVEAPDQAEVRRFEDSLPDLPVPAAVPIAVSDAPLPPSDLGGTWTGTGDEAGSSTAAGAGFGAGGPLTALYHDYFTGDAGGREAAAAMLARLTPSLPRLKETFARAGLPATLLGAGLAVSGFDVEARARDGRAGPWLLSVAQARAEGLRVDRWLDERRDPVRSTEAAARLLAGSFQRFGGWPLALAAYHAGPEAIEAARPVLERLEILDLPHLLAGPGPLSRQTRLFLARATALGEQVAAIAEVPSARPPVVVQVPGALTLETAARVLGVPLTTVRQLNPALLLDRVAPFSATVALRVPAGTAAPSLAAFDAARTPADRVTVLPLRLGESAEALAEARGLPPRELARVNGVRELTELRGPTELLAPVVGEAPAAVAEAPGEPALVPVTARAVEVPGAVRRFYFVNDGDQLEEIAAAAEVSVADLLSWNNLDRNARLQPRMVLQLFVNPALDSGRIALVDADKVRAVAVGSAEFHALEVAQRGKTRVVHAVRPGDTIAKIARRYGLGVPDLARINRMSWNSELSDGQNIVVYAPAGNANGKLAAGRSVLPKRGGVNAVGGRVSKPVVTKPVARPAHVRPVRPAPGR